MFSLLLPRAIADDEYTFAGRNFSRQLFVDGTPEVSEAGGELVENHERNDSTVRRRPNIVIGFEM